jgi:hypothetical protein
VATFFYRRNLILVAPNKIGSMASETILDKLLIDAWHARDILQINSNVNILCLTRDPVSFFVSGYRYLRRPELEKQYHSNRRFDWHMEACLENYKQFKQDGYNGYRPPHYFDAHSWWGPVRTVENELGKEYLDRVKWIKLEDSYRVKRMYMRFLSNELPSQDKIVINATGNHVPYPRLTDYSIRIMKTLCDWENTGYNFRKSVWKYQHR